MHGFLLLQLRRYSVVGGNVCKDRRGISIHPGQFFGMSVFLTNDSLERTMCTYRVVFVIYHLGNSVLSGYYMIGLGTARLLISLD